jgi:hypothetical protein
MQPEIILDTNFFCQNFDINYFSLVTKIIFYLVAYFDGVKYLAGTMSGDLHVRNLTAWY